MRRRVPIIGVLMLCFTAMLSALAPAAFAHNALISSSPAADSVLPVAPTAIELVFDQDIKPFQPKIAITITGHDPVQIIPTINGPTVTADLTFVDLPGSNVAGDPVSWRVGYRIVSADGHPVAGLLNFSVGSGPAPTIGDADPAATVDGPSPSQANANPAAIVETSSASTWWWIGGAMVAAAAITALVIALRCRRIAVDR